MKALAVKDVALVGVGFEIAAAATRQHNDISLAARTLDN